MSLRKLLMGLVAFIPAKGNTQVTAVLAPDLSSLHLDQATVHILQQKQKLFEPFEQLTTIHSAREKFASLHPDLNEDQLDLEFSKTIDLLIDKGLLKVHGEMFHSSSPSRAGR